MSTVVLEITSCEMSVYLSSAQEALATPSFSHRNAVENGPAGMVTATLLDRQRLMLVNGVLKMDQLA